MDSMKKVMGAVANSSEKDTTGGKIQKAGQYVAKTVSAGATTNSTNRSGFDGTSQPKPKYQGR